jgi:hypothetical protein
MSRHVVVSNLPVCPEPETLARMSQGDGEGRERSNDPIGRDLWPEARSTYHMSPVPPQRTN